MCRYNTWEQKQNCKALSIIDLEKMVLNKLSEEKKFFQNNELI